MLGYKILELMLQEGLKLPYNRYAEVITEIEDAIRDNTIFPITQDGKVIGVFTYFDMGGKYLINNCVIFRQFRDRWNLLKIRKYFRDNFKGKVFYWNSDKHDKRLCQVTLK